MNARTVTIAILALPIFAIIGGAIVVREVQPRIATRSGSAAVAPASKATMTRPDPADAAKRRAVRFLRASRAPAIASAVREPRVLP